MKRSITRWTMAAAAAGLLALPVSSYARTQDPAPQPQQQQPQPKQPAPQPEQPQPQPQPTQPQPEQPQPQQPAPTPQPTTPEPTSPQPSASTTASQSADQSVSPQDHLRQAQAAVNSIDATSVPAKNRASLAQLKRHLATLEKTSTTATTQSPSAASKGSRANANWGTEVAAIDKIITDMIGSDTSSPAAGSTTPNPTGTSGKTSSTTVDDATRAKLMDVRTHITAYAAGMSGSSSTPRNEASMSPESASAAGAQSASPSAAAGTNPTNAPTASSSESTTPQSSPAQSAEPQSSQAQSSQPQSTSPQQGTAAGEAAQNSAQSPQTQVDAEAAHRHLVAARDALSQLTQLPAAAQLNGDARTQVSQLISNFNELINAQSNWRASYDKVDANMNTLLGSDNTDAEAKGGAPTTATGATAAPGAAVGTSGTAAVQLDPTIRAKLVEVRQHLTEFQKASGGESAK